MLLEKREQSTSEELSNYKLPESIEVQEDKVSIKTPCGVFHLPREIFELYVEESKGVSLSEKGFPHTIPFFLREDKYDENSITIALRAKVREFLKSNGLNPEDFLDEHGYGPNEKTQDLYKVLPQEILNEILFSRLIWRFSPESANKVYTHFEHELVGGSSGKFFGQEFMGGFIADEDWQEKTKKERENNLKAKELQGIILFRNKKEGGTRVDEVKNNVKYAEASSMDLGQQVRVKLKDFYEEVSDGNVDFKQIDFARVVLVPVPYDTQMQAFPKPVRIEFIKDKKVIASTGDKIVLKHFQPKREDCELADVVVDKDGTRHNIAIATEGFEHNLKFTDEDKNWYDKYLSRISK